MIEEVRRGQHLRRMRDLVGANAQHVDILEMLSWIDCGCEYLDDPRRQRFPYADSVNQVPFDTTVMDGAIEEAGGHCCQEANRGICVKDD